MPPKWSIRTRNRDLIRTCSPVTIAKNTSQEYISITSICRPNDPLEQEIGVSSGCIIGKQLPRTGLKAATCRPQKIERERGFTGDEGEEAGVCDGEGCHGRPRRGLETVNVVAPESAYDRCVGMEFSRRT
ncbi:hypothetical protein BHE74_00043876 [Ensete ventricosum]|nr:hypothetical protein BHE74_00043876 [Ensete ventricosum]